MQTNRKSIYYKRRILDRVSSLNLKYSNDVTSVLETIESAPYSELSNTERTYILGWIERMWPSNPNTFGKAGANAKLSKDSRRGWRRR